VTDSQMYTIEGWSSGDESNFRVVLDRERLIDVAVAALMLLRLEDEWQAVELNDGTEIRIAQLTDEEAQDFEDPDPRDAAEVLAQENETRQELHAAVVRSAEQLRAYRINLKKVFSNVKVSKRKNTAGEIITSIEVVPGPASPDADSQWLKDQMLQYISQSCDEVDLAPPDIRLTSGWYAHRNRYIVEYK